MRLRSKKFEDWQDPDRVADCEWCGRRRPLRRLPDPFTGMTMGEDSARKIDICRPCYRGLQRAAEQSTAYHCRRIQRELDKILAIVIRDFIRPPVIALAKLLERLTKSD